MMYGPSKGFYTIMFTLAVIGLLAVIFIALPAIGWFCWEVVNALIDRWESNHEL